MPPHHHSQPCPDVAVVVIYGASTLSAQCCSISHHACRVIASVLCVFSRPGLTYPRVRVAGLDTIAGEIFCVPVGRTPTCRPLKQRIRLTLRCHFGETMAPAPPRRRTTPAVTKTLAAVFAVVLCASTAPLVQAGCPSGAFLGVCACARVDGAAVVQVVGCNSQRVWAVTHVRVVSTGSSLMSNSASTYDIKELCTWHGCGCPPTTLCICCMALIPRAFLDATLQASIPTTVTIGASGAVCWLATLDLTRGVALCRCGCGCVCVLRQHEVRSRSGKKRC